MDFGRGGGGGGAGQTIDPALIMDQVRSEMSVQYFQAFFQTVRDQCFQKCITRPGSSMSSSELQCLANCCDRYIDATKVVAGKLDTVQKAAEKEQGFGGGLH